MFYIKLITYGRTSLKICLAWEIFHVPAIKMNNERLVKKTINESFFNFINYEVVEVNNKKILHVICKKSNKEVFINDELWVRTGPSTDKLIGQDMVDYIRHKF